MVAVAIAFVGAGVEECVLCGGPNGLDPVLLGDEAFQRPNRDRCVNGAPAAGILAGRGTDAPADRSKRVGRPRDPERVLVAALGNQLDVAARIRPDRTAGLALHL